MGRPIADRLNLFAQEKSANELEQLRQSMQNTLRAGVRDGQLIAIMAAMAEKKKAKELEEMRQSVKKTLQSSLHDGRLETALRTMRPTQAQQSRLMPIDAVLLESSDMILKAQKALARVTPSLVSKAEEDAQAREALRLSAQSTLQAAVCDGRLAKAIATVKQERAAETMEDLRQSLQQTFTASLHDGRLSKVIAQAREAKKAKESEHLRQTMKETLQTGVFDGRLVTIITAMKEKKQAQELNEMRQSVKQTLQSSLIDGRLSKVIATLRADKDAQEFAKMRLKLQHTLRASLLDGRLSAVVASVAEKWRARELEAMRQSMQLTLRTSLLDGRLSEVVSHVLDEREKAKASAQFQAISAAPMQYSGLTPTPTPAKPTSAKTTSRPLRRRASRSAAFVDEQVEISSVAESLSVSASLPPLKVSALPPRPTAPSSKVTAESLRKASDWHAAPTQEVRESSCGYTFDMLHKSAPSPRALLPKPSRPTDSECMLPPVTPPSRRPSRIAPSAMSLDLGIAGEVHSSPSMSLGLDKEILGGHMQQMSQSRSSSKSRVSKTTLLQGPSFLPPLVGIKSSADQEGKSAQQRSGSMDSFMWGVAPLINSRSEWDVAGQLIL